MSFSALPNEIVHAILVAAVQVRGVQRATRLRLVSRSWDVAVVDALFDSGILDASDPIPSSSSLWPRYLAHRVLHTAKPFSRRLHIIRRIAERVLAFRGEDGSDDALRSYVSDICRLYPSFDIKLDVSAETVDEDDEGFKQALLAAAASTGDLDLVEEMLPSMQEGENLIYQDGYNDDLPAFLGWPLEVAALRGNTEVVRTFLDGVPEEKGSLARGSVVEYAGEGNHLATLELGLEPEYPGYNASLVTALEETTSVEVFERLYPLAKDHLADKIRLSQTPDYVASRFLPGRFRHAVRRGAILLMEHLVQLGAKPDGWDDNQHGYENLVSEAAERGHEKVVAFLLEQGVAVGSRSLEAAVRHGNPAIVRLLLNHGIKDSYQLRNSLLEAVKRENESLFRLLAASGATTDDTLRRQALGVAEGGGFESMARLVIED